MEFAGMGRMMWRKGGGGGVTPGLLGTLFDGTNDKVAIAAATSGLADGPTLLLSFWSQRPTGAGGFQILSGNTGTFLFDFVPEVALTRTLIRLDNTNSDAYESRFVNTYSPDVWNHFAVSYNRSTGKRQRYLNGVATNDTLGPTGFDLKLSNPINFPPNSMGGDECRLSEIYIGTGDFDLSTGITSLRTADGLPANLGADGSLVTGTAPEIYAPNGNMGTNAGSGGDGTVTGSPTEVAGPGA